MKKALVSLWALILVAAIAAAALPMMNAEAATTLSGATVNRLYGDNRIETAIAIGDAIDKLERTTTPTDAAHGRDIVIANGFNFPDALSGVSFAASNDALILLVDAKTLDKKVEAKINEINPANIYILGGENAVSADTEKALSDKYNVTRIFGQNRYDTCVEIAKARKSHGDTVFIVSGENYPDALSASPVASMMNAPMMFCDANGNLPTSMLLYIRDEKFTNAVAVGGTFVVSDAALNAVTSFGVKCERVCGTDRYQTSAAVYTRFADMFDKDAVSFAAGTNFPDALAGGVYSADRQLPLLLLANEAKNPAIEKALMDKDIKEAVVYGGTGALTDNTIKYVLDKDLNTPVITTTTTTTTTTKPTTKPTTPTTKAPDANAQAYVNKMASKYGAVGVQVAVIDNGQITGTYNYGYATKSSAKMNSDHKIRVASLSKVCVAINAMKMQEEGIVNVNTNIGNYWGVKLPKAVTLKSLLTHTSTLGDLSYNNTVSGTKSQLKSSGNYRSGTVGSKGVWRYNNYGVGIAGATLEMASGKTLNNYANDKIFTPLGMDASFSSGRISGTSKLATLYYSGGGVARSVSTAKGIMGSSTPGANSNAFAGGLTCSAQDYAKLIAMLANDGKYNGKQILSANSVATIEAQNFTTSEHGGSFGQCMPLRYKANYLGESKVLYHTGNAYGVLALASYNPDTKDGVVVVTTGASDTRDSQGVYAVCSSISEYMYKNVI